MQNFTLSRGTIPVMISMPHNGDQIPADIAEKMTALGLTSVDTDWYKDKLYEFAQAWGLYIIKPNYSRYVIDLNRDPNGDNLYPGANSTELCPTTAFDMSPLYLEGQQPTQAEVTRRIEHYWYPYHQTIKQTLSEIKAQFGGAILLDAHSIKSQVPRFFEGQLPDFNFGTADGHSCDNALLQNIEKLQFSPYSIVSNGRFKGGYITRAYGQPKQNVHAIQLELSQRTYMNEVTLSYDPKLAEQVIEKLKDFVQCIVDYAQANYKG